MKIPIWHGHMVHLIVNFSFLRRLDLHHQGPEIIETWLQSLLEAAGCLKIERQLPFLHKKFETLPQFILGQPRSSSDLWTIILPFSPLNPNSLTFSNLSGTESLFSVLDRRKARTNALDPFSMANPSTSLTNPKLFAVVKDKILEFPYKTDMVKLWLKQNSDHVYRIPKSKYTADMVKLWLKQNSDHFYQILNSKLRQLVRDQTRTAKNKSSVPADGYYLIINIGFLLKSSSNFLPVSRNATLGWTLSCNLNAKMFPNADFIKTLVSREI